MSDPAANSQPTTPTADRLKGKTIVYFSSHSFTDSFKSYLNLNHPDTRFIVLPISYGHGDTTPRMTSDLLAVLKEQPVNAVVFDTTKCDIDAVLDGATNPVNPILPQNRNLPVVLFTGAQMNREKTHYWITHSMDAPVPKSVSKVLIKPLLPHELCDRFADTIDEAQSRQRS